MKSSTWLALTLMISALSICSCTASLDNRQNHKKQSLYERVIQSGKIRCGYLVYPPGLIKDPNTGKLSGIGFEAIELIGKKLGLTIEWTEEVGWGTMQEGLQTDRYDMIGTPVWTNANRARVAAFSNPLFYSPVFVFSRKDDTRFKNHLELINSPNVKISIVDGTTGKIIADQDFPQAARLTFPESTDLSQNMLSVATRKADVTIGAFTTANRYMKNNPNSIEPVNADSPIREFGDCWIFKRGEFEFKGMLDTVLDEIINSGAMDKIINKYKQSPNEIYSVALPYRTSK